MRTPVMRSHPILVKHPHARRSSQEEPVRQRCRLVPESAQYARPCGQRRCLAPDQLSRRNYRGAHAREDVRGTARAKSASNLTNFAFPPKPAISWKSLYVHLRSGAAFARVCEIELLVFDPASSRVLMDAVAGKEWMCLPTRVYVSVWVPSTVLVYSQSAT